MNIIKSSVILLCIVISTSLFAQVSDIGYKEFKLGNNYQNVTGIIQKSYSGKKVEYLKNGDIILSLTDMVKAELLFDHKKTLYKIFVKIKYGDALKVKERIIKKYGRPNDLTNEEYDSGNKLFIIGRWLMKKRFKIALFESYYCRNQKMIPCHIEVLYLDKKLLQTKLNHERSIKEEEQKKKDAKTYDGF